MTISAREAANLYVSGLKEKDLERIPFAPGVTFDSPLTDGRLEGVASVLAFLRGVLPIVKEVRVQQHIVEGEHVCSRWILETSDPPAVIPICDYFRVSDGLIHEVRPYYDPRPITNP